MADDRKSKSGLPSYSFKLRVRGPKEVCDVYSIMNNGCLKQFDVSVTCKHAIISRKFDIFTGYFSRFKIFF